jgi:hypothetical protein
VGLVGDIELGPGVLAAEHEVADDRGVVVVAEGDDDGGRETGGLGEQLAVAVEVGGAAGEPLVQRRPAVRPADERAPMTCRFTARSSTVEPFGKHRLIDTEFDR